MQTITQQNLQELQYRCQRLAGQRVTDIAQQLNQSVPSSLLYAKGWLGQLVETYLGASAQNQAIHDFPELKLELKTVPVTAALKPLESTYVCTVHSNEAALAWRDSWAYQKLKQVLWVPIISEREIPIGERIFLTPIFWDMDAESEEILRTDWEELMEMVQLGQAQQLQSKFGQALHIRPKAANSRVLGEYVNIDGSVSKLVPKGFYLRTSFTGRILQRSNPK